jgi:integral membrane sensor domain MASE1
MTRDTPSAETTGRGASDTSPTGFTALATSRWTRAVVVAIAYFAAGQVHAILGWTSTPAILWPPNGVLLAALLATPTRDWWVYVLAALPADHAIGWSLPIHTRLALYAANTGQTLVAASLTRWGSGGGPPWGDRRFVLRFCFGVFAGPCVGGILGAAAILSFRPGASFWTVWRGWIAANVLTLLALVPLLTIAATWLGARLRGTSVIRLRRAPEAAVLFVALAFVALAVFEVQWARPEAMAAMLYAPHPLLLWAALRM